MLPSRPIRALILAGALLGALLLVVAEFTSLFEVRVGTISIRTVSTGSHHGYALVPLALLVATLAVAVSRTGSRPALLAIALLGLIALLVALLGDLPDANATGLVLRASRYASAASTPSVGMYMETLGAVVLVITAVCGFLLTGPPPPASSSPPPRSSSQDG